MRRTSGIGAILLFILILFTLIPPADAQAPPSKEGTYTITVGPFEAFSVIDDHDRPVKYVRVKAETPDDGVFVERTDVEGYAYFIDMPYEEFPNGTKFSVRSFTFSDPIWEKGEEIPKLENDYQEFTTFSIIVYSIPLVLFLFLLIIPRIKRK